MHEFNELMSSIEEGNYLPFYLLSGVEPYFIDQIESKITDRLIDEASRSFDYSLFYGKEVEASHIIEAAKRFPMLSSHHLVVVREAQHLDKYMDVIADYLSNPQPKTILVLCYKYKVFDKRKKLYKNAKKKGIIYDSKPLYDNQLGPWILEKLKASGFSTDNAGLQLLCEALGNDLTKIEKEIGKLKIVLSEGTIVSPELIQAHIGFSKDYNNFELYKALGQRDFNKCCQIVKYMSENPKNHPLILTISGFYTFFRRVLMYHGLNDKSKAASTLGVNPYFLRDYEQAARVFNLKQASKAIHFTLEADLKSKGVGVKSGNHKTVIQDLLVKVFAV
jgi:DNA polymerase-3 subunit delta